VEVVARQAWSTRAVEAVPLGDADLALVREHDAREGLSAELVRREPLSAFLSARHPLADRAHLRLEDLRDQTVVVVPEALAPGFHGLVARLCKTRGFQPVHVELGSPENREPLLAHLSRHPDRLFVGPVSMGGLAWAGIRNVPIADDDARLGLSAVWAGDPPSPPAARALEAVRRVARRRGWCAPA
jgi:DNA-binding transcriptional LysR family regulator